MGAKTGKIKITNMVIELTKKEEKLLAGLLSLDLDAIGYDDDEIEILNGISKKIEAAKK